MKRLAFFLLSFYLSLPAADKMPVYTDPKVDTYFKDWLLCGPFPNPLPPGIANYRNDATSLGFYRDYLMEQGGESRIKPFNGMGIKHPDGRRVTWQPYHGYFSLVPLDELFTPNTGVIAYAACNITSSQTRPVIMSVTSNDGVRVWQNGQLLLDNNCGGTEEPDRDLLPILLQKGENQILVKIIQGTGKWSFQFRLLDLVQTAKQLESRIPLFIRPQIKETDKAWEILVGESYKVELLPASVPAIIEILSQDQKHVLASFSTAVGKSLSIKKDSIRLANGLHPVICRIQASDGTMHAVRTELFVGPAPTLKEADALFKSIPASADSSFAGRQIGHISRCIDFQLAEGLAGGNAQAMDSWSQSELCHRYWNWRNALQITPSPYHKIFPLPQDIRLVGAKPFRLPAQVSLIDSSIGACRADMVRLCNDLKVKVKIEPGNNSSHPQIILRLDKRQILTTEAYTLSVREKKITVTAVDPAGLHNGLVTLRLLLLTNSELAAAEIVDFPSQAHRCAFQYWPVPMTEEAKQRLLEYIDLKYNEIVVYSSDFFKMDDPAVRKNLEEYFDFLRSFNVEPIPTVWLNPDMAQLEGVQLTDEPVRFSADTCRFGFQCLVDLETSRPLVHSRPGGGTIFTEGTDYKIVSLQPPVLRRLATGHIPQNEPVYLDADLVDLRTHRFAKACPSEEKVYQKFSRDIERVIRLLHPQKIHVNHDEIGIVNSDSRCRKRGLTDYELVAYQINRMRDIIKAADSKIDMIMWADAVNPYHNAGKKNLEKTCELLYRDIIMAHWYYDAENYQQIDLLELGAKFFIDKGFRMYGCPWDDLVDHQAWERVLAQYRTEPQLLGLMHTQWGDRTEGIAQTGASNWEEKTWLRK